MSPVWNCAPSGCPTCRIAVMPRVVPRQIVEAIDKLSLHQYQALGFEESAKPAAILSLIDKVPSELFVVSALDYGLVEVAVQTIRRQIERWQANFDPMG